MATINRLDGTSTAIQNTQQDTPVAQTGKAEQAEPAVVERTTPAAAKSLTELSELPVPRPELGTATFTSVESFAGQLKEMGGSATSADDLLANFLKLQMLGGTWDLIEQALEGLAHSTLRQDAYEMTKSGRLAQVDALRDKANQLDAQADDLIEKAFEDASPAGARAGAKASRLQDEAAAKWEQANQAATPAEAEALRQEAKQLEDQAQQVLKGATAKGDVSGDAIGGLLQAAALYDQASSKRDEAGGIMAGYADGLAVTATVRKGADAMNSAMRNQDFLSDMQKRLRRLLDDERADRVHLDDALHEMEESRNEVARLLLDFVDKSKAVNAGKTQGRF